MNKLGIQPQVDPWLFQEGTLPFHLVENIFPADPAYHQKISFNGGMAKLMGSFVDCMGLSSSLGPWKANGGS